MALTYEGKVGDDLIAILTEIKTEFNRIADGTGWRDISTLLGNGWTLDANGFIRLVRRGRRATIVFAGLNGSAATGSTIIPTASLAGFRPAVDARVTLWSSATPYLGFVSASSGGGGLTSAARVAHGSQQQEISWEVNPAQTWPTVLPGSAVA
ncbi:hypothetical protein GTU73_08740 [Rathayibacter sp. VKM Ac-2804]|uniref:hypothetical protein n=1 Tax=Rathayibacter sp. VKM Ac-2804 TaxID=2609257 RepID=UPI00132EFA88|nr:hypothetical protein [Rathayibacter sp. VKM Ac-2804]QHF24087.1 hypothetical protein GTU73_08740 [Rathayibacter sp. VKM Ac-2804]